MTDEIDNSFTLTFLGGVGEIGRNCTVLKYKNSMLLIDCGLMFPTDDMPGVDVVLPDLSFLETQEEELVGVVLTHGHEDHIGALSYLLRQRNVSIYGSSLTIELAAQRINESRMTDRANFVKVSDLSRHKIGPFDVEFIPVAHSVPEGFALAIHMEDGIILHSGDFKIDLSPIDGRRTDLTRIGYLASTEGIKLLLADSTNAERPGLSESESLVQDSLLKIFEKANGRRVIVACFASHIHRIDELLQTCLATGRKVGLLGRSMVRNVSLATELGLLRVPDNLVVGIDELEKLPPEETCIISTGSQGEPLSALSLLAGGDYRGISVGDKDMVILSSQPIPGNERAISGIINGLMKKGADVIHSGVAFVHASGHARQGELAMLLSIAKPEFFIPVHGEYRHLSAHASLAVKSGIKKENTIVVLDGDSIEFTEKGFKRLKKVRAGYVYVDGLDGDLEEQVLRDRKLLSTDGVIACMVVIDRNNLTIVGTPELSSLGFVDSSDRKNVLKSSIDMVTKEVEEVLAKGSYDLDNLKLHLRKALSRSLSHATKRRPMIIPIVTEV